MLKCLSIPQIPDFKRVSFNKATTQGDLYLKGKGKKIKQVCIYTHFYCDVQKRMTCFEIFYAFVKLITFYFIAFNYFYILLNILLD